MIVQELISDLTTWEKAIPSKEVCIVIRRPEGDQSYPISYVDLQSQSILIVADQQR